MRISLAILIIGINSLVIKAQEVEQQQLIFGLNGADIIKTTTVDSNNNNDQTKLSSFTTTNPTELYLHAISLLDTLSSKTPLTSTTSQSPPPTTRIPNYSSSSQQQSSSSEPSPYFDQLEINLGSILGGKGLKSIRKILNYLYGAQDGNFSLRSVVRRIKSFYEYIRYVNLLEEIKFKFINLTLTGNRIGIKISKLMNGLGGRRGGKLLSSFINKDEKETAKIILKELQDSGEAGHSPAWLLLGDLYLSGFSTIKSDPKAALHAYTKASENGGLPEAQYKLGFLYASNYGNAVGAVEGVGSQGSALLHYTFGALAQYVPSSMTVGYRHWVGIGTKQSCADALGWYKAAADEALRTFNAGPPGGRLLPPPKIRLSDLKGGAYGPGSSSSSQPHITGGSNSQTLQEWNDLLEFHLFHAERGDSSFMFRLGRLYYQGFGGGGTGGERGGKSRLIYGGELDDGLSEGGRDFMRASKWFMRVAKSVWAKDIKESTINPMGNQIKGAIGYYDATKDVKTPTDDHFVMAAGLAAGFLGRMYLRGEGVRQDYAKAFWWFMRGNSQGDRESNNGLGIMFRDGLGVERDLAKANMLFLAAAQQDLAEAQVNLGKFHFGIGEFPQANNYFEHAIRQDGMRQSDTFQSFYYLAELNAHGGGNPAETCPSAVAFYKSVAEKGDWGHEVWWEAERAWGRGDSKTALLGYWIMAERGYEVAQNNVAWILDRDKKRLKIPFVDQTQPVNVTDRLALAYWTRSAAQDNVDALIKMGDYYYAGVGVDSIPQFEKAAACYQSAANSRVSALAMWNLGWMHERGQGVKQDYHLAKRFYDMALETSPDAYFPATLSLISLHTRSLYNSFFGVDDSLKSLTLFGTPPGETPKFIPPVHGWSAGRAWRDIQRRWGYDPGPEMVPIVVEVVVPIVEPPPGIVGGGVPVPAPGDGTMPPPNPPPVGQHHQHQQQQQQHEQDMADAQRALEGNDDPMYARRAGGHLREEDEEDDYFNMEGDGDLTGTLAIVALCIILGWLLYFRQGQQIDGPGLVARNGPAPPVPAAPPVAAPGQVPAAPQVPPPIHQQREADEDEGFADEE